MESYAKTTLIDGEKIIKEAEIHSMRFFWPLLGLLFSIFYFVTLKANESYFIIFVLFLGTFIWSIVHIFVNSYELTLTNYRIVARKGFFNKKFLELQLYEIDSVIVNSADDIYDTLTISGRGTTLSIPYVKNPLSFRKLILNTQNGMITQQEICETTCNSEIKYCRYCGSNIMHGSTFCPKCGKQLIKTNNPAPQYRVQTIHPQQPNRTTVIVQANKSNGMGTAGFIFAILGIIVSWAPGVNFVIWFLGFLFSFIGLFKSPRGMAITGFILSIIGILIIIAIFGSALAILSTFL